MKTVDFRGYKYVSQKAGYVLEKRAYIDKGPTGVGITTWLVSDLNTENTIVVAPTLELFDNLLKNRFDKIDKRTLKAYNCLSGNGDQELAEHIGKCNLIHKPWKIITTGDSLRKLEHLFDRCRIVLDESDEFISNASESDIEKKDRNKESLLRLEAYADRVTFLSSTPVTVSLLPEWIQKLDQIEYIWKEDRISPRFVAGKPTIQLYNTIVEPMNQGKWISFNDGKDYEPVNKLIVFINDVQDIVNFVQKYALPREEVQVFCGNSVSNDIRLRKAGVERLQDPNDLPKYTFVTRAGWRGISLYDDKALTVVLSKCTNGKAENYGNIRLEPIVNLYSDLEQILGRNRSYNNIHKEHPVIFYSKSSISTDFDKIDELFEEQRRLVENTLDASSILIEENIRNYRAKDPEMTGRYTCKDVISGAWLFDECSFQVAKNSLKEKIISITRGIRMVSEDADKEITVQERDVRYKILKDKVTMGCRLTDEEKACPEYQGILEWRQKHADKLYPEYYSQLLLGLGRKAQRELTKKGYEKEKLVLELHERFKEGEWYLASEVKQTIQEIFDNLQIRGKAKATTLAEFAEVNKRVRQSKDVDKGFYIRVLSWKE